MLVELGLVGGLLGVTKKGAQPMPKPKPMPAVEAVKDGETCHNQWTIHLHS